MISQYEIIDHHQGRAAMHFELSARGQDILERAKVFIRDQIEPAEPAFWAEVRANNVGGDWTQ